MLVIILLFLLISLVIIKFNIFYIYRESLLNLVYTIFC